MNQKTTKIAIMRFVHIGGYIYDLLNNNPLFKVNYMTDIGNPEILKYLFDYEQRSRTSFNIEENYFINVNNKTQN